MRIHALALAAASAAAASAAAASAAATGLLVMAPAHASAATVQRGDVPTYTCAERGPAPLIYPAIINGMRCDASNGAPTEGDDVPGPIRFIFLHEPRTWVCDRADAGRYPERVVGHRCFLED